MSITSRSNIKRITAVPQMAGDQLWRLRITKHWTTAKQWIQSNLWHVASNCIFSTNIKTCVVQWLVRCGGSGRSGNKHSNIACRKNVRKQVVPRHRMPRAQEWKQWRHIFSECTTCMCLLTGYEDEPKGTASSEQRLLGPKGTLKIVKWVLVRKQWSCDAAVLWIIR